MDSPNILFARQPIYDSDLSVYAYELLFRPANGESPAEWDGDVATSQLVLNAFVEIGMEAAAGEKKGFINFTRNWLVSPPPFEPHCVGVEVLESVEPDAEVIAAVRSLVRAGYTIALDDFSFEAKWVPLLQLAEIVKIDVLQHRGKALRTLVGQLAPYGVDLLAEKVEDYRIFEECKSLGFKYFQGYFFCRPQSVHGDSLPSNKLVILRLLAELQNSEVTIDKLEQVISSDISLSTKILRICNTVQYPTRVKVDSIRQAVMLVGLDGLTRWGSIIALSRMSDKPRELVTLTLTRAKMMEVLAGSSRLGHRETCFTVGMFSLVDAFFDRSRAYLLEHLPFSEPVEVALLSHEGKPGKLLGAVEAHEAGQWDGLDWHFLAEQGIDEKLMEKAYLEAVTWSSKLTQSLVDIE